MSDHFYMKNFNEYNLIFLIEFFQIEKTKNLFEMRNKNTLQDIPIEQTSNETIRKYDAMSKKQKYHFLLLFSIVNILFFISHKYGPPSYHIETIPFEKSIAVSNTRKFLLNIGEFNFLNDFITFDMVFMKNYNEEENSFVDVSLTIKSIKGKRSEVLYFENSKQYQIKFTKESNISNKIRLYSRGIIDFVHLDSDLVMKFSRENDNEESLQYSGAFLLSYTDASHTIIEALIRLIFFIFSIIWVICLNSVDYSKTSTPLQLKLVYYILILVIIASNPFYVLSYFTESPYIPFMDSFFAILLIFSAFSMTLIILDSSHEDPSKITTKWLLRESSPFIVMSLFFLFNEYSIHFSDDNDAVLLELFKFARVLGISFCYIVIVVSTFLFKTKTLLEKGIIISMIIITLVTAMMLECIESIEPLISSNHAIQIFTFASVSTYVFFLAFFYLPVDPMDASDDIVDNNNDNEDENSYDVIDTN